MEKDTFPIHSGASQTTYDIESASYDELNAQKFLINRQYIDLFLQQHKMQTPKRVLDLGCGTGEQSLRFAKAGSKVMAVDISPAMQAKAKQKAKKQRLSIRWIQGDMTTVVLPESQFDLALLIFNTLGHLTIEGWQRLLANLAQAVTPGGLLVFDIFNAEYYRNPVNLSNLTIDWVEQSHLGYTRKVQYSELSSQDILYSTTIYSHGANFEQLKKEKTLYSLQLYTIPWLKKQLEELGFSSISFLDEKIKPADRSTSSKLWCCARKL